MRDPFPGSPVLRLGAVKPTRDDAPAAIEAPASFPAQMDRYLVDRSRRDDPALLAALKAENRMLIGLASAIGGM